ncbi:DUF2797 domain-containing protein [Candidiatus Paracoxiella cheracis]|uniref:DUF2797 domain-containing protein n=1 Tax=Candidiatus Paracoxiella cheracis TaxID=3405120 RepID=UPI003BF60582
MQIITGTLRKMKGVANSPVEYVFRVGDHELPFNETLDKTIYLRHTGEIYCIQCRRKTNKSFQQGYCFPCLKRLSECNLCIIHPERCNVEQGTCPKDDWAHAHCYQSQIIYLANSSGLKVGITRETQVPTRWIDQGAKQAIPIFKASNRYQAGVIEVALKAFVSDRTNWRAMLKQDVEHMDLIGARDELLQRAEGMLNAAMEEFNDDDITPILDATVTELSYPILKYPQKVTSLSLDKTSTIEGRLQGIKGQYLILDVGVLNVRKFGGYAIECGVSS